MLASLLSLSAGIAALISGAHALPIAASRRDIFNPTITSPVSGTVWTIGTQVDVTWDTSNAPELITAGSLVTLNKGGITVSDGPGSIDEPLAKDFDLRDGKVTVTVPDIEPGDDYQITLFGDSGNRGEFFTIAPATSEEVDKRDVFVPQILEPNVDTVWTVGSTVTVTWDTSDAPENISNGSLITLDQNQRIVPSGPGSLDEPLVEDFDLRAGSVSFTVPDVAPGTYEITLFGDSGNISPSFQIVAADAC